MCSGEQTPVHVIKVNILLIQVVILLIQVRLAVKEGMCDGTWRGVEEQGKEGHDEETDNPLQNHPLELLPNNELECPARVHEPEE